MKHKTHKHGFTLIELLVVMSIIALLLSILMPALGRARAEAMLAKDQSQVKAIYSGFSFWAPSHNGRYPIPGLEQRMEGPMGYIKGRGPEDLRLNDHASMLSMCIMQNLFTPDILFAPTEQADSVAPIEMYNYDWYNASNEAVNNPSVPAWQMWDPLFRNELTGGGLCHNSYGIMPLTGKRKHQNWGISTNSPMSYAVVGTRGPVGGKQNPNSTTNLFHGIERDWKGVVTFGDGHTEILETFYPMSSTYLLEGGGSEPDNIFEEADGEGLSDMQALDDDYMPSGIQRGQGADIILTHVPYGAVGISGKGGNCTEYMHD